MSRAKTSEVTELLSAWRQGDGDARERLIPIVYGELRSLAAAYLRRERRDHTLEPTAVVHEAYLKLIGRDQPRWEGRVHFFAVAAQLMRRVLVDHARGRRADKRGGELSRVPLDGNDALDKATQLNPVDLIDLDDALHQLARKDKRKSQVIELRYFGGLNVEETAQVLGVSKETIHLDTRLARAWLRDQLARA